MKAQYPARLALIALATATILHARPAAAQQPTYDPRSGNYTTHERNADGSAELFGCNPRTGATWYERYQPDRTVLSLRKDGMVTLYEPDKGITRRLGTDARLDANADPACPPAPESAYRWNYGPVRFITEEELRHLGKAAGGASTVTSPTVAEVQDDSDQKRSEQAKRDFERATGVPWGPVGCLARGTPALTCAIGAIQK
jgi:hypothetical protein